jgi:hypothetical protein
MAVSVFLKETVLKKGTRWGKQHCYALFLLHISKKAILAGENVMLNG